MSRPSLQHCCIYVIKNAVNAAVASLFYIHWLPVRGKISPAFFSCYAAKRQNFKGYTPIFEVQQSNGNTLYTVSPNWKRKIEDGGRRCVNSHISACRRDSNQISMTIRPMHAREYPSAWRSNCTHPWSCRYYCMEQWHGQCQSGSQRSWRQHTIDG